MRLLILLAIGCSTQPATETQYLVFQHFTGAGVQDPSDPTGAHVLIQGQHDYAAMLADDEAYIDRITSLVAVTPAHGRVLGYAIGPLALDLSTDEIAESIRAGFDAALDRNVAVVFHLEISHFWKLASDDQGRLSDGRGADDVREWMDFSGTIAAAGAHPGSDDWQPNLLPAMCFTHPRVQAMVDRYAAAIGQAVADGMAKLDGHPELFGGVVIGWEAGSDNPLGYHALSLAGYDASAPLSTLRRAQQQILHDYLERWARDLNAAGISTDNLYTHITNCTQWDIDHHDCNPNYGNGPDAFWEMFNDYSIGGISNYANESAEGTAEAVADAAREYGDGKWAMLEGTNINILTGQFTASDVDFETYLAKIVNHGGVMVDIFGVEGQGVDASSEPEAVAAYQKLLAGKRLVEH